MPVDLVVPVKELRRAKSRLVAVSAGLGVSATDRRRAHHDLALALAADTLAAALASSARAVVVVTSDPRAGALARGMGDRVTVVPDEGAGLDAAVRRGAAAVRASAVAPGAVAVLQADLPALRAEELDAALALALRPGAPPRAHVADHAGTGTTLLVTGPGRRPEPRFGIGSAAAHAATGAIALDGDWPGLRLDVDTPADLDRARALGVGPATAAWPAPPEEVGPVGTRPIAAARGRC